MSNKTFARIKTVLNKEVKIPAFLKNANKKTIAIVTVGAVAIVTLSIGVLAAHWKIQQRGLSGGYADINRLGQMMGQGKNVSYSMPAVSSGADQFALPADAAKSGELAIVVNDLASAKSGVTAVAAKNGGSVYATFIAYASNNIKNGSIVVQVPAVNFDATFGELEKIGSQIVQESTQQIPQRNIYPYPMPLGVESSVSAQPAQTDASASDNKTAISGGAGTAVSSTAPASIAMPIYYPQTIQDKGYIRVIFADYGTNGYINSGAGRSKMASVLGVGYMGQNLRASLLVVLGVKLILLVALVAILVVIGKKMWQHFRASKKGKVRQLRHTGLRAVRIKRK